MTQRSITRHSIGTQAKPADSFTNSTLEKVESERSSPSSEWKSFASNTTLHGLRYAVQNGLSIPRRAIWLLFLCAAASAYTYNSTLSIKRFVSRPTKTVITQETPTDGLKFPAVTICNLNKFMKTKIDMKDEEKDFVKMGLNISGCSETHEVRGNLTCGQALLCAYDDYGPALVDGCDNTIRQKILNVLNGTSKRLFDQEKLLASYGHDIAGLFLHYCRFSVDQICSEKDFVPTLTRRGICYTFNSGYSNSTIFYSEFEGPELSLSAILNVLSNESTVGVFSTGLKVVVHDQRTFINRHNGFNILPGTHSLVAIKLIKHSRLPAPYKTNCSCQDQLPGFGNYTKDGCIYQCIMNHIIDHCGCHWPGYPDSKQLPVCSFQDQGCVTRTRRSVNLTECPCNDACSELEYESRVSYSKFPENAVIKIMRRSFGINVSKSYMRQNYVFLQVGFQRMSYEKRVECPSYGPVSLLGELGGNMGLFLGCSILTLCEFLDFLWEVLMSRIRKHPRDVAAETNNAGSY